MPFDQLRSLVVSLIEPEFIAALDLDELDDESAAEFDTRPTNCLPCPRASTIDQLIAALPRYEPRFARGSTVEPVPEPPARREPPPPFPRAPGARTPPPLPRGRDRSQRR